MKLKDLLNERLPAQGFPEKRHTDAIQSAANVKLNFFKKGRVLYYMSDDANGQVKLDPDLNGRFDMYMSNEFGKTVIDTERKDSIEWSEILKNFKKHT